MSKSLSALFLVLLGTLFALADEAPKTAEPGTLLVIDAAGKEQKVKGYRITQGVRKLSWLAPADKDEPAKGEPGDKRPAVKSVGPEALVFRDEMKFNFAAGVTTLIPLDQLRSISFDGEKSTMSVRAAVSDKPEEDVTLVGTTLYKGINKFALEAEVDKGAAGVAEVTYQGGMGKGGIKGVHFPAPKVMPSKMGRPAVVVTADKDLKKSHKVSDLQPLYQLPSGREKPSNTLMFKKTLKLDVANLKKITANAEEEDIVWEVEQKDGESSTLTLLQTATIDGQMGTLTGFIARVPVGYKLFPLRRISAITFDTSEEEKEKEKP